MYAPIVMFVYNRKDHTEQVINKLAENKEAKEMKRQRKKLKKSVNI